MAQPFAFSTSVHEVLGSNPTKGRFQLMLIWHFTVFHYKSRAKSSVTNRLPWFYPRYMYILKCFTALEWCVE